MTAVREKSGTGLDPQLRRLAVVVLLGGVMTVLDTTIVNVAVTAVGTAFDASLSAVQWVLTGYVLALSMAIPLTGWSVRRFGGRTMWLVSLGLFIGGSLLCGLAWSVVSLVAFRVVQGVGGGMLMPIGQMMLARAAGPDRMGRVMSVISVPMMVAPVLGPLLGGVLVEQLSWRWMFFVNVPFCAVALLAAVRMLPSDTGRDPSARLDFAGMALLCPGLAALVYGLSAAGEGAGPSGGRFLGWTVGGGVLIAAFVVHALRKGPGALIELRLLRARSFTTATGGIFLYSAAMFGLTLLVPMYAQVVRGDSALDAGWLLAPMGLGAMVTMPVAGRLADKYGARWLGAAGVAAVLAATVGFTAVSPGTGRAALMGVMFLAGAGHGVILPSLMAAAYRGLPAEAVPAATTGANVLVRIGSSIGTAVLAIVLQAALHDRVPGGGNLREAAGQPATVLNGAFVETLWWTAAILAAALLPVLAVPMGGSRRSSSRAGGDVKDGAGDGVEGDVEGDVESSVGNGARDRDRSGAGGGARDGDGAGGGAEGGAGDGTGGGTGDGVEGGAGGDAKARVSSGTGTDEGTEAGRAADPSP
ncbi:MDR family MFS transporter [Spirillospora sp. NPDC050679]